eukprot:138034-Rhodomonas_salina.4
MEDRGSRIEDRRWRRDRAQRRLKAAKGHGGGVMMTVDCEPILSLAGLLRTGSGIREVRRPEERERERKGETELRDGACAAVVSTSGSVVASALIIGLPGPWGPTEAARIN